MKYDIWLCDDGTMDTVVEYMCPECGETHEFRYDWELAAQWREASGALMQDEFFEEVVELDIDDEECPNSY
jgi:hypothetical protein